MRIPPVRSGSGLGLVVMCGLWAGQGCSESLPPETPVPVVEGPKAKSPTDHGTHVDDKQTPAATPPAAAPATGETELVKFSGIRMKVPTSWIKVPVSGNIPEAEYTIPHIEGDEFDGRLTLMSASGTLEENLARWKGEFGSTNGEPKVEDINVDGTESKLVDIRGEWKGTSFRPVSPPRGNHRMLTAVIPLPGGNSYYIKYTGPLDTLIAREREFRDFLTSATVEKTR